MAEGRRRVWSARALRSLAWISATGAFVASWGVLGALPKPTAPVLGAQAPRDVVIVRKILRRVIVQPDAPPTAPPAVTWTQAPSAPSAPLSPPVTSTGGS
jgi:hypothetical protein